MTYILLARWLQSSVLFCSVLQSYQSYSLTAYSLHLRLPVYQLPVTHHIPHPPLHTWTWTWTWTFANEITPDCFILFFIRLFDSNIQYSYSLFIFLVFCCWLPVTVPFLQLLAYPCLCIARVTCILDLDSTWY